MTVRLNVIWGVTDSWVFRFVSRGLHISETFWCSISIMTDFPVLIWILVWFKITSIINKKESTVRKALALHSAQLGSILDINSLWCSKQCQEWPLNIEIGTTGTLALSKCVTIKLKGYFFFILSFGLKYFGLVFGYLHLSVFQGVRNLT